jgi:hypothetical protein
MKKLLVIFLFAFPGISAADCYCTCMNGENQPICENAIDLKPICAPKICPIEPPSIKPINPPTIPPIGTKNCRQEQVWDYNQNKYVWKQVCSR